MPRQSFPFVGKRPFEGDDVGHDELFGHLVDDDFTAEEAAEYLEVSLASFRRLVQDGSVRPSREVGRYGLFSVAALKTFKSNARP